LKNKFLNLITSFPVFIPLINIHIQSKVTQFE
jgi:hypothetical protein